MGLCILKKKIVNMKRIIISALLIGGLSLPGVAQKITLDSCKFYALKNNKRLKVERLNLEAAKQVKKNAFTNYFPKINAGIVAMKANKYLLEVEIPEMNLPVYDGNPTNLPVATQFAYMPGMNLKLLDYTNAGTITAIQPIYVGGRIRNGNKLASLGKEFSQLQLNLTKDEVLVATEYYYWTILALEEKKKTLTGYEELLNSLMKDVSVSHKAGLVHKSDLLKVQLEINNINAKKLKLENGLSLLKMTLAQHIGLDYTENLNIADTIISVESPSDLFNAPKELLLNRSEYKMLNKAVDAEILQKKITRGEYMPSMAVGVQGLYLDVMEQKNKYGLAFATVSIPLSGWWGGSHKIKEHKIKVNIAKNELEEKSELIMLQMDKTYKDLNESYEQIFVAESSVLQAMEHLSVIKDNFDAGVVSTSDLLEAQALYQKTLDALVDAKTTYKIKSAEYLKASAQLN